MPNRTQSWGVETLLQGRLLVFIERQIKLHQSSVGVYSSLGLGIFIGVQLVGQAGPKVRKGGFQLSQSQRLDRCTPMYGSCVIYLSDECSKRLCHSIVAG